MTLRAQQICVLNKVPNRNDATGVANNVRLTIMGAIQFSMVPVYTCIQSLCRKVDLPEMRDNDMKTAKVYADGNKHCPGKE